MDLGSPASYLTLEPGTRVYSSDGRPLGRVEHVLADPEVDIFDGLVIDRSVLPGGHRFVDAERVEEVYEHGVALTVSAAEAEQLPEPSENPGALSADPAETAEDELTRKLRHAWDLLSGRG